MSGANTAEGAANLAKTGRGNLKPRMRVKVGEGGMLNVAAVPNEIITFPLSANCMRSNFFAADRFKIVCSLYADPNQSSNFWADFDSINVSLEINFEGYPGLDWTQVFRGVGDKLDFDLHKGTVTITGRNFAALMIDTTLQAASKDPMEKVINDIAARHNLKTKIEGVPAEATYGSVVGDDKVAGSLGFQTNKIGEWDLLSAYAQQLGNVVYELNGVLYFVPSNTKGIGEGFAAGVNWECLAPTPVFNNDVVGGAGTATGVGAGHVTRLMPSNSIALKATHDFQFSQYTQSVAVHHKHHIPETVVLKFPADEALPADLPIKRFYFEMQNKTDEDAKQTLQNYHNVMNFREWLLEWKIAGPDYLTMDVVDTVTVTGTASQIDGLYGVSSIEFDISERGFTQTIKGVWGKTESGDANNAANNVAAGAAGL